MTAGESYGITPFGTETMHVLRAEKGYIIVGQETDGTTTPGDLGMDWIVSKQKDVITSYSIHYTKLYDASVYRQFKDINEFMAELETILKSRREKDRNQ